MMDQHKRFTLSLPGRLGLVVVLLLLHSVDDVRALVLLLYYSISKPIKREINRQYMKGICAKECARMCVVYSSSTRFEGYFVLLRQQLEYCSCGECARMRPII